MTVSYSLIYVTMKAVVAMFAGIMLETPLAMRITLNYFFLK